MKKPYERRKPYTKIGVRRLRCYRRGCENRAEHQWQICADGNIYRPICAPCDVELNGIVLAFMGIPGSTLKLMAYAEKRKQR